MDPDATGLADAIGGRWLAQQGRSHAIIQWRKCREPVHAVCPGTLAVLASPPQMKIADAPVVAAKSLWVELADSPRPTVWRLYWRAKSSGDCFLRAIQLPHWLHWASAESASARHPCRGFMTRHNPVMDRL
jgi:hypothetical protein